MSDIRVFNLKNKKTLKRISLDKKELQKVIEDNSFDLLGVSVIASNINLTNKNNEVIETLGYDEDYRLVVIEYRCGKFGSTINKGLVFLDYIRQNKGKIRTLLKEKVDEEVLPNIIINPRLISIGDDFNKYDDYAINQLPFDIDLIKYKMVDKDTLVLEKIYTNFINEEVILSRDKKDIYEKIDEFVLSLGDEVSKTNINSCVSYRRIKNFMYILEEEYLSVILKQKNNYKKYSLKTKLDVNKIYDLIESAYDEI